MDRFEAMEMFIAVADHAGFAAAARALRVSPPSVARGIAWLENRLGTALFHRSTRAVSLTEEGQTFLESARRLLAELSDAERQMRGAQSEPSGQLYVTAPVTFGRLHVLPVITALLTQNCALSVKMMLIDRNVRIVEEGIDVAVRIGPLADSALKLVQIGCVYQKIVASPSYLLAHGIPKNPADLSGHHLIATSGPRAAYEWRFGKRNATLAKLKPRLLVNTVDSAIAAAEAGFGIANLLNYQVDEAVHAGRLVEVLRQDDPGGWPINLLFEASRGTMPATRAFVEAMQKKRNNWSAG